jgi:cbb3-type cytochrome oxidase maturation protein
MSVMFIALPIALLLGASGLAACSWCIRAGQFRDLDSEAFRILGEDRRAPNMEDQHSTTKHS